MTNRRRKNASGNASTLERQLARAIQHMADLCPVHQIAAVKYRHTRKPTEAGVDQVVVVARADNTRIRVKASEDRIDILAL